MTQKSRIKVEFLSNSALNKSNSIKFVHGNLIRPNSTIEFDVCNSKFRNSNDFVSIRPRLGPGRVYKHLPFPSLEVTFFVWTISALMSSAQEQETKIANIRNPFV